MQGKSIAKSKDDIQIYSNKHAKDGFVFDYSLAEPLKMIYSEVFFANDPLKGDERVTIEVTNLDSGKTTELKHSQIDVGVSDISVITHKRDILVPGKYSVAIHYHGTDDFEFYLRGDKETTFSNLLLWKKLLLVGFLLFALVLALFAILQPIWQSLGQ